MCMLRFYKWIKCTYQDEKDEDMKDEDEKDDDEKDEELEATYLEK